MIQKLINILSELIPKYKHDWFALLGLYLAVEAVIYTFVDTTQSALFWIGSGVFWGGSAIHQRNEIEKRRNK